MKDKAIKDAMNSIENRIRHVYNQGYEDGLKDGMESMQTDETEAYKLGLETAWELARKLSNLGFNDTRKEIFGEKYGLSIDIIKNFSVDEVAAKIKEYEEKQTKQCCKSVMTLDESIKWLRELKQKKADERRRGMTREEAREELIAFKDKSWDGMPEEVIDMAIKALEQEPCDDAISRQAAIDALQGRK